MSTIDTICSTEAGQAPALGRDNTAAQPKPRLTMRLWASFLSWRQTREGRYVLRELTNEQLRDIGLTRRQAMKEVNKSFFWD
ncbi:DUF1127 domain-containing protein [Rhizobium sp. P38BS-XIX]|uniref:DUF1127 domain-containing protein n=1 Tax=Rhizobium sp. P38BS-XIX TaxID=2726740 RepID=UPI0014569EF3|nr:DUF1127 domain-containing protein [Rhizobium sp. P38BS-XIX]NLR96228.1 DUF1127 domain-containing protein [Rhizobium sp. P38BS-XIX]